MSERLNILISAYSCRPGSGSEPAIGWNFVKEMEKFHNLWVITDERNRSDIENFLLKTPLEHIHWLYYNPPAWLSKSIEKLISNQQLAYELHYYYWQIGVYFIAMRLYKEIKFHFIHHITFCCYWRPSFLPLLPVPFIWGPVGGGESAPKSFYKTFSPQGKKYEFLRDKARWIMEKDPFVKLCGRKSVISFASTEETSICLSRVGAKNIKIYTQAGLSKDDINLLDTLKFPTAKCPPIISIGRLLHWKGFHLSLMAFSKFHNEFPEYDYWIIGDGPERTNLEILSHELKISDKVYFLGSIPRNKVLQKLEESSILIHPSFHDSAGLVCLEAMAAGRPLICLDLGGPGTFVTEKTGIKVPALHPEQVIKELTEAMVKLAKDPLLQKNMGKAGKEMIKEYYHWEKKGEYFNTIYNNLSELNVKG